MSSKYQMLHDRGLVLSDDALDFIVDAIDSGIELAREFLGVKKNTGLHYISADNKDWVGYVPEKRAINLPLKWLNWVASVGQTPEELRARHQRVSIEDYKLEVLFEDYLVAAGIEETIHHFQDIGHPNLQTRLPKVEGYDSGNPLVMILSEHEVEARTKVDEILRLNGRTSIWEGYDQYLRKNHER